MKTPFKYLGAVAILGLMTLAPSASFAQEQTTTTITSTGTVNDWKPDAVAVKVDTSPTPIDYSFTRTTTYVDQFGNPISVETVRSGAPVTVYYHNLGGKYVADKVIVNRSVTTTTTAPATESTTVTTAPPAMPPTETTTTTTTAAPSLAPPAINGVVTDAGEGHIDLRTAESSRPIHYEAHDATAYLDENGNPVPRKLLTPGTPVTLFYEQNGDNLMATRVIVKSPAILDR
jgi:hypothetical protein